MAFASPHIRRGQTPPGGSSTFDPFSWSEGPDLSKPQSPAVCTSIENNAVAEGSLGGSPVGRPTIRMHQPAGGVSTLKFGDQLSLEEAEALLKRRPGSDTKKREMSGSGIFSGEDAGDGAESPNGVLTPERSSVRLYQSTGGGVSQISFGGAEDVSPKKPTSLPEVAKQKELSGSQETYADVHHSKLFSNAKAKELEGSDIFGPPPEIPPRSLNRSLEAKAEPKEVKGPAEPAPRNVKTHVKVSNPAGGRSQISFVEEMAELTSRKVHDQKMAELTGNDIFRENSPMMCADKPASAAKLREISGSDIFADHKPAGRDCVGGIRKPPGGESSIALV